MSEEQQDLSVEFAQAQDTPQTALAPTTMSWLDLNTMRKLWKMAENLSRSSLVPASYQGKPENVLIAMDIASRINTSLMFVMQNLYIVKGNPSWAGQACKAMVDGCGLFVNSEYIISGSAEDGSLSCYLQAVKRSTGKLIAGPTVTLRMAHDEGWFGRNPKWQTMPELMLRYRAASFFARTECPSVLQGIQTVDETEDVRGGEKPQEKITIKLD